MEELQQLEWNELTKHAMERLRKGNTPDLSRISQLFQILVLPSFEDYTGWEVCRDVRADTYFAVRTIWQRETDAAKLETPIVRLRYPLPLFPTIEVKQFPLESDWVEMNLLTLKSLSISAMPASVVVGLDGISYEVAFDNGSVSARYHWWWTPPAGWHSLNNWMQETLAILEKLA